MNLKRITRGSLRGALALSLLVGICQSASAADYPAIIPAPPVNNNINAPNAQAMDMPQSAPRTTRDISTAEQVRKSIEPYSDIGVDAERGTVRLSGTVNSEQERGDIIRHARGVGGVQSVESHIRVNTR